MIGEHCVMMNQNERTKKIPVIDRIQTSCNLLIDYSYSALNAFSI